MSEQLTPTPGQTVGPFYGYALPFDGGEHDADLDLAMDSLRTRYGRAAVTRGSLLHRPLGPDAPMLTEQD